MMVITSLCIPFLFQDSKECGHAFRSELKEEMLVLMARDRQPAEVGVCPLHVSMGVCSDTEGPGGYLL